MKNITESANTVVPKYEDSSEFFIAIEDIFEVHRPIDSFSCDNDTRNSEGLDKLIKMKLIDQI